MTTSRASLTPFSAELPSTNAPQLIVVNGRPCLGYDATTQETAYWSLMAPQGIDPSPLTISIAYMMASATTGGIALGVSVEAITDGDATDLDAATSFDSINTGTVASVPGTAGYIDVLTITLTNNDSLAAADYLRISVARVVADSADTATGDLYLLTADLRDDV